MKRFIQIITILLFTLLMVGCNTLPKENDDNKEDDSLIHENYSIYYQYKDNMKGLELYCYEKDSKYYSVLMPGTDRLKTIEEIKKLQNEYPCLVETMKDILLTYSNEDRKNIKLFVISNSPTQEEITNPVNIEDDNELVNSLYTKLGLIRNENITDILIHPNPSSGIIYTEVGKTLQLTFNVYPENVKYQKVTWYSSNNEIVKVNQEGLITSLKEGSANIVLNVDGVTSTLPIRVDKLIEPTGTFKLTIIDKENLIIDLPKEEERQYIPGIILKFHSRAITDVNVAMYVDSKFVCLQKSVEINNQEVWEFEITTKNVPSTIEFKTVSDTVYSLLFNSFDISSINKVRHERGAIGVSPGAFTEVKYSVNQDDIHNLLGLLYYPLIKISNEEGEIYGGGFNEYCFYNDNEEFKVYFGDNNTVYFNNQYYQCLEKLPQISNPLEVGQGFVCPNDFLKVNYQSNNYYYGELKDLNNIDFKSYNKDDLSVETSKYYVNTLYFGYLDIIDDTHFGWKDSNNIYHYYELINMKFSDYLCYIALS